MKKVKKLGKHMTLGGGVFTVVMLITLYLSFIKLPDGTSHGPLAEAIGPWIVCSLLGILIFISGLILWCIGFIIELIKKLRNITV